MRANTKGKHEIRKRFAILTRQKRSTMSISTTRVKPVPGRPVRNGRGIKHRTLLVLSLAAMVGAIAVPVAQAQGAGAVTTESADVVIEWNNHAQTAIIATANQGPTVAYLHLAMVQGAVYDAVNAIEGGYEPYLGAPATADPDDSAPAAVATAAHDVLVALFPSQQPTLDTKLAASLDAIPDGPAETGGIEVGAAAAVAMLDARANDGRFPSSPFTVIQGDEPGEWRSTSFTSTGAPVVEPAPWVGNVKPFLIPSAAALRSDGPNALTSAAYAADFNEVKLLGAVDSPVRTDDQTVAAKFWQANGAALFNDIFRQLAGTQELGQDLDIAEAARMFAMTNMAGADGAIGCWKDKYYWNFWRPITAIRQADNDRNPATLADQTWTPLFATPAFPEHPSGHTCISGAVVETLQDFFGTDKIAFDTFSSSSNSRRSFERFSEAINEIIDARVWAGIHFRTADVQGAVLGQKVARYLREHYFQPGAARATCEGQPATIVGTAGSDVRVASPGRDVIAGLGGNDTLSGLAGNDLICGGKGKDKLNGGGGKDKLLGQVGKDKLNGGGGKDLCNGGKGKDTASKCEVEKSI
jgi:hypothetical protein